MTACPLACPHRATGANNDGSVGTSHFHCSNGRPFTVPSRRDPQLPAAAQHPLWKTSGHGSWSSNPHAQLAGVRRGHQGPLLPYDMHPHTHLSKKRDVREDGGLRVTNPAFCHHVLLSAVSDMLRTRSLPVRLADGASTLLIPTLPSRFTSHSSTQEAT